MSATASLPSELWLQIFGDLGLSDLLSANHVNTHWRSLIPYGDSQSDSFILFRLAMKDMEKPLDCPNPISLADRLSYVKKIEETASTKVPLRRRDRHPLPTIPEPYRMVLTEWPVSRPPPGFHWPHSVRHHATGYCSCIGEGPCSCEAISVGTSLVMMMGSLRKMICDHEEFDFREIHTDSRRDLFCTPPRLFTDEQNKQTLRFVRMHADESWWTRVDDWQIMDVLVLRLSRYSFVQEVDETPQYSKYTKTGDFVMIMEGPARGEIYVWSPGHWPRYNGFEAMGFLAWKYEDKGKK